MRGGRFQPVAGGRGRGGDGLLPRRPVRSRRRINRILAPPLQVRIRVRRKTEKEEKEEGQRPHHHHTNQLLIISVIITVFLMVAPAVTNKYHIKYKISRIYQPYNLSSPHRWVFYRCKLNMAVKACKHSNLNVDVQLLLQTKLFNLVQIQRGGQTGPNLYCCYPAYLRIQNRFYHFLRH